MRLRFWAPRDPSVTPGAIRASRRELLRKLRKWAGYGLAGMLVFTGFVWMNLPTRALAWRVSHEAKKRGFLVTVDDL